MGLGLTQEQKAQIALDGTFTPTREQMDAYFAWWTKLVGPDQSPGKRDLTKYQPHLDYDAIVLGEQLASDLELSKEGC